MAETAQNQIRYDIVPESLVDPDLDRRLVRYLSGIFPEWAEVFARQRAWHDARPVWTTLARLDGEIIGHTAVVERTLTTDWNWRYKVASVQGVSVLPAWRSRGMGRKLLDLTLAEARRRKYPFAIIFCKERLVPYYRSLGWLLPEDSMVMWKDRALPIHMRSNCPMYQQLLDVPFPEGPVDVHNPFGFDSLDTVGADPKTGRYQLPDPGTDGIKNEQSETGKQG